MGSAHAPPVPKNRLLACFIKNYVPSESIFATFYERKQFLIESGSVQRYADPKQLVPRYTRQFIRQVMRTE